MFSVIRLEGYMNFFIAIGMFMKVLYLPSTTVVKTEVFEERFLRKLFLILHFQSLGTMTQFLFNSRIGNET